MARKTLNLRSSVLDNPPPPFPPPVGLQTEPCRIAFVLIDSQEP